MLVKWYDGSGDADVVNRLRFYISFSASVIIKHSEKNTPLISSLSVFIDKIT